jgi:lactoylglutathione lyase
MPWSIRGILASMGLEITGFGHTGIRVRDLERTLAFYEVLGFRLTAGPMGPEPVAILEHESGVELNLVINADRPEGSNADVNLLMDVPAKHPGITHVALVVADVAAAQAALEAAGIALSGGPIDLGGKVRAIFVRDPDRTVIELHQVL